MSQTGVFEDIDMVREDGSTKRGTLSCTSTGVTFEPNGKKPQPELKLKDIHGFSWTKVEDFKCVLGVVRARADKQDVVFTGFQISQKKDLEDYATQVSKPLTDVIIDTTGRNWGELDIQRGKLIFESNHDGERRLVLSAPAGNIEQCVIRGKAEAALEILPDEAELENGHHVLSEISFYIPRDEQDDKDQNRERAAFHELVRENTSVGEGTDEPVTQFADVKMLVPRGSYELAFHKEFFRMQNKTFKYKHKYSNINKIIQLKLDDDKVIMVIGLRIPLKHGRSSSYPYLLLEFRATQESLVDLNMTDEEIKHYNDINNSSLIQRTMRGPTHVILSRVLKAFTERPVIIPGKSYVSADGFSKFLSCSYKANAGFLFMLEKSFFFSHKPPMLIRHDDIESIEFARMEQGFSGRMFDLVLKVRGEKPMTFTNVDRKEYNNLFDFLVKKDMHIDNLKTRKQQRNKISGRSAARVSYMDEDMQDEEDDEDEDEDFEVNSDGSSSESDSDLGSEISGDGGVDSEDEAPKRKKKVPAEKKEKKPKKPKVTKEEKQSKAKVLAKKLKKAGIKRPASAYALFVKEIRSQVVAENPSWGFKEISVEVGMRWKACPEEKKEAYKAQYVQAKAEFEEKVKELPDLSDGEESDKKKKKKKKKDPDAPKRALSGYQCFLRGERENIKRDHPEVGPKDLFKKFGELWKVVTDEMKTKYDAEAKADKERFKAETEAYEVKKKERKAEKKKRKLEEAELGDDGEGPKKKKKKKSKKKKKKKSKKQDKESDGDDDAMDVSEQEDVEDADADTPVVKGEPSEAMDVDEE